MTGPLQTVYVKMKRLRHNDVADSFFKEIPAVSYHLYLDIYTIAQIILAFILITLPTKLPVFPLVELMSRGCLIIHYIYWVATKI